MAECVRCGSYTSEGHPHYCDSPALGYRPKETVYAELPEREPDGNWFAPGGNYGPHKRELVNWHYSVHEYRGLWRGYLIRVFPQEDSYRGRLVVRWYADVRGRQRVHGCWNKERAMDLACGVVDAELAE